MGIIAGNKGWIVTLVGEVTPDMEASLGEMDSQMKDAMLASIVQGQVSVNLSLASTLRVAGCDIQPMEELKVHMAQVGQGKVV